MDRLQPIRDRQVYSDTVAKMLEYELYMHVFKPVMDIFGLSFKQVKSANNAKQINNAKSPVAEAIKQGRIALLGTHIKGNFNAAISKEIISFGGVFDKKLNAWKVDPAKLPTEVKLAAQAAREEHSTKLDKALKALEKIQAEGLPAVQINKAAIEITDDLREQLERTTKTKGLEVPMAMSGYIEDKIRTEYTENLNLYIKEWTDESIVRLRKQVEQNAIQGYRAEAMRQAIINEYGVSANKAKFLARQETSLLVSKYREENYKEAGVNFYQWSTSGDGRVRQSHKDLNGRIFSWQDPPIVDPATGRRGHPGTDYGCRCIAVPVLMSQMEKLTQMSIEGKPFKGNLINI